MWLHVAHATYKVLLCRVFKATAKVCRFCARVWPRKPISAQALTLRSALDSPQWFSHPKPPSVSGNREAAMRSSRAGWWTSTLAAAGAIGRSSRQTTRRPIRRGCLRVRHPVHLRIPSCPTVAARSPTKPSCSPTGHPRYAIKGSPPSDPAAVMPATAPSHPAAHCRRAVRP